MTGCNTTGSSSAASEGVEIEEDATPALDASESSKASEAPAATGLGEEALEAVTAAAANTAGAGTSRFELFVETAGTGAGDGMQPVNVQGEEDFDARLRNLNFVGPEGALTVIVDDTDVYVEVPATEDEDWARIELDALMEDGVGFGRPAGLPFQSPQDNIAVLSDAITAAAEGGPEDLRGEPATRYDLVVDLEAAAEQAADDTNETFDAVVEQSGITELDMQVWVGDEDDRISRVSYTLGLAQADIDEVASELAARSPRRTSATSRPRRPGRSPSRSSTSTTRARWTSRCPPRRTSSTSTRKRSRSRSRRRRGQWTACHCGGQRSSPRCQRSVR